MTLQEQQNFDEAKRRMQERGKENLLKIIRFTCTAARLSDGELIDAVYAEIYREMNMCAYPSALLEELLTRFQLASGVEETPQGITVDGEAVWGDLITE